VLALVGADADETAYGSCVFAEKPGDGSAREQAASCQRVLGGMANVCHEFATKRYRSNCINWGILPLTLEKGAEGDLEDGDYLFLPRVRALLEAGEETIPGVFVKDGRTRPVSLSTGGLSPEDREILLEGCLMNYYAAQQET